MLRNVSSSGKFNQLFSSKPDNKVDPLHSNDGNIATDPNEIEDILFDSFFAGRHLIEKSPDFNDVITDKRSEQECNSR